MSIILLVLGELATLGSLVTLTRPIGPLTACACLFGILGGLALMAWSGHRFYRVER
ncbi:MAG: hypothetical protein Q8Q20_02680 [bacterium]|nr:hypothetical protein [bacterium]